MAFKIVERNIGLDARNVTDKDIKNKWVWNWLLEKDINDDYLSDYVKKIDQPGVAMDHQGKTLKTSCHSK